MTSRDNKKEIPGWNLFLLFCNARLEFAKISILIIAVFHQNIRSQTRHCRTMTAKFFTEIVLSCHSIKKRLKALSLECCTEEAYHQNALLIHISIENIYI